MCLTLKYLYNKWKLVIIIVYNRTNKIYYQIMINIPMNSIYNINYYRMQWI